MHLIFFPYFSIEMDPSRLNSGGGYDGRGQYPSRPQSAASSVNMSYSMGASTRSLYSSRSMKSMTASRARSRNASTVFSRYRKPLIHNALFTNLQNGSYIYSIYSIVSMIDKQNKKMLDSSAEFITPSVPVKSVRFSLTIHYNVVGVSM